VNLLLALGFAWIATTGALAGGCEEKDYRALLGPPRNQEGTRWCYAHSAADLISQAVGKRVSSIDLATTFLLADEKQLAYLRNPHVKHYLREHPDFFVKLRETRLDDEAYLPDRILTSIGILDSGGNDEEAILLSNLKGLCLEKKLPANANNVTAYLSTIHLELSEAARIRDNSVNWPAHPIGAVENEVSRIMAHTFQKWVDSKCRPRFRTRRPLVPHHIAVADNTEELVRLYGMEGPQRELAHAQLIKELDRVLDSGKVAAIAYNAYDLFKAEPRHPQAEEPKNPHSDHSSVVAARKMMDGQCMYFVRNHFGPSCGYLPKYEARCEKDQGGLWVPASALKHLYSVISIE
jgi:hypothetical protein